MTQKSSANITACPDCDLLVQIARPTFGHKLKCPRCQKTLDKPIKNSIVNTLALSLAGLLIYFPAVLLPILTMNIMGISGSCSVVEGVIIFYKTGYVFTAFILLFSSMIFPLLLLMATTSISLCLYMNKKPLWLAKVLRFYDHVTEWAMVEIYLLGIIIAIIKMANGSDINYNSGFFLFILLVLITAAIAANLDKRHFWEKISPSINDFKLTSFTTASENGLSLCHDCNQLALAHNKECQRCGASLHLRRKNSISRTVALVTTSILFLVPANCFPIMRVDFLGTNTASTILDGIIYFFHDGDYFIGAIILIASVLVPIFKVIGISILLFCVIFNKRQFLRQKTKMYRLISLIGRWSMLDVFVIALLSALVNFGFLSQITTGRAATYFCAAVVITMLATITFDPRLLWDQNNNTKPQSSTKS